MNRTAERQGAPSNHSTPWDGRLSSPVTSVCVESVDVSTCFLSPSVISYYLIDVFWVLNIHLYITHTNGPTPPPPSPRDVLPLPHCVEHQVYCMCALIIQMCGCADVIHPTDPHIVPSGFGGSNTPIPPVWCEVLGSNVCKPKQCVSTGMRWFVKRLMCLNPLKGSGWIQAALRRVGGGRFHPWDSFTSCVYMIFMC